MSTVDQRIYIHEAFYETKDVTTFFREKIVNNSLFFSKKENLNLIFGDPLPGSPKILKISFNIGTDGSFTKTYNEYGGYINEDIILNLDFSKILDYSNIITDHAFIHKSNKILILSLPLGEGGTDVFLQRILKVSFLSTKHYIILVSSAGNLILYFDGISVKITNLSILFKILDKFNLVGIHINHTISFDQNFLSTFLSDPRIRSLSIFFNIHDFFHLSDNSFHKFLFNSADKIFFPTKYVKDTYAVKFLSDISKMQVINHTVFKETITHQITLSHLQEKKIVKIGFLGAFVKHKGCDLIKECVKFQVATEQHMKGQILHFACYGALHDKEIYPPSKEQSLYITFYGKYFSDEEVINKVNTDIPDIFLIPSIVNETYCYAFDLANLFKKPVITAKWPSFMERFTQFHDLNPDQLDFMYPTNFTGTDFFHWLSEKIANPICKFPFMEVKEYLPVNPIYKKYYTSMLQGQLITKFRAKNIHDKIKPFAIYFPQFYDVEENSTNFYPGYTDMINLSYVKMRKVLNGRNLLDYEDIESPLFGYYDLLDDDNIIEKQIKTARHFGIYGFAIYHYWFSNYSKRKVMYKVIEKIFSKTYLDKEGHPKFFFYFIWANENWIKGNSLNSNEIIKLTQNYDDREVIQEHFNYLKPFFDHPNYYKVSGESVFSIHHPHFFNSNQIETYKEIFNKEMKIRFLINGMVENISNLPSLLNNDLYYFIHSNYKICPSLIKRTDDTIYLDYADYITKLYDENILKGILSVFTGFDNLARLLCFPKNIIRTKFINSDLINFSKFLSVQMKKFKTIENDTQIFLINAWNEWGENMVLEPSNENYYKKLKCFQNILLDNFQST